MRKYRVLAKRTEYRNFYVEAESEEEAERMVIDGEADVSEFADGCDEEVVETTAY